jgi:hypothetical protein
MASRCFSEVVCNRTSSFLHWALQILLSLPNHISQFSFFSPPNILSVCVRTSGRKLWPFLCPCVTSCNCESFAIVFWVRCVYNIYCQFHFLRSVSWTTKHSETLIVVHYCRWVNSLLYFLLEEKVRASFNWMQISFKSFHFL